MRRPAIPHLRSARLPGRWRTLLTAAAVTAALVPAMQAAAANTYRAYRAQWFPFGGHSRRG